MDRKILDLSKYDDRKKIHKYIAAVLDFPKYYGANLDALYEVLTDKTVDTYIDIILSNAENGYSKKIVKVFMDAAKVNSHIMLNIGDGDE